MVPRPLALAQAMKFRTCANIFQPCQAAQVICDVIAGAWGNTFLMLYPISQRAHQFKVAHNSF